MPWDAVCRKGRQRCYSLLLLGDAVNAFHCGVEWSSCLFSKNNLWTLDKASGSWPPPPWTLRWSLCLVFGVWCRQVLHPSRLLPGHAQSGSSVSGPSWVISCCLCSQCCPTKQCELTRWLSALSSGFGTPQSYSAKQEAPFKCKCLKLSRNQFPLVRK